MQKECILSFEIIFLQNPTLFDYYSTLATNVLIAMDVANATTRIDFASYELMRPREESRRKLDTLG